MTEPSAGDRGELLQITLRRSHVYGLAGLCVGLAIGWAAGQRTASPPPDSPFRGAPSATAPSAGQPRLAQVDTSGRPAMGPPNVPVTVVEFTDYQCPFCRQHFRGTLRALMERYGERIRYVVRHYPIAALHPRAFDAAVAAECAFEQGAFWAYHQRLFEAENLDTVAFTRMAAALDLDGVAFARCLSAPGTAARVREDIADGSSYGVTGTPTFFVNGRMVQGAVPHTAFEAVIEEVLTGSVVRHGS